MTERELLEAAARAAGIVVARGDTTDAGLWVDPKDTPYGTAHRYWNALTDDGDALRLAVKLNLDLTIDADTIEVDVPLLNAYIGVSAGADPYAATRRAIVRAAAATQEKKT